MARVLDVDRGDIQVAVTHFLVSVSYEFSSIIDTNHLVLAIAASTGVDKSDIKVKTARRLAANSVQSKLAVDTEIKVADAAIAKDVKMKTSSSDAVQLELTKMGVNADALLKSPPSVAANTEMKIVKAPYSKLQPPSGPKLAEVGSAVGGTVTIVGGTWVSSVSTTTHRAQTFLESNGARYIAGPSVVLTALVLHMVWPCVAP